MKPQKPLLPVNTTMGATEWGLLFLLSMLWGGSFFFVEVAVRELPPFSIVFCRVTLGALILHGVMRLRGKPLPRSIRIWSALFVMGALNNVIPFSLIVWGQTHIDSSVASILNASTPIFSVVLTHFLTREERLTPLRITGVLLGWFGVTVLIGLDSLVRMDSQVLGKLAVIGASVSYAFAAIFARRYLKGQDSITIATGMLTGSGVIMAFLALPMDKPWTLTPGFIVLGALLGLAALSTALAYLIYFRLLITAGATNSLLVTFLVPVSAVLLGVFILGERPGWNSFGGMVIILLGLLCLDGRIFRLLKPTDKTPETP